MGQPEPAGVLTANFPSASEMLGWGYGHVWAWLSGNPVLTLLGIVGLVVIYGAYVFRQAVTSV